MSERGGVSWILAAGDKLWECEPVVGVCNIVASRESWSVRVRIIALT